MSWAEIHQAPLSVFSSSREFYIGKMTVEEKERRDLTLSNLYPE
jgi:hypothetical protein